MLKVGDKYYCIKNRDYYTNIHKAGKIYKVVSFNLDTDFIRLGTEFNEDFDDGYVYSLIDDDVYCYFYDYFISLKEYRKQKLQKICLK